MLPRYVGMSEGWVRRCCPPSPPVNAESGCAGRPGDMGIEQAHCDHRSPPPSTYHVSMSRSGCCTVQPAVCDTVKIRAKALYMNSAPSPCPPPHSAPPPLPPHAPPPTAPAAACARSGEEPPCSGGRGGRHGAARRCQHRGSNPDARPHTTDWPPPNRQVAGSADCRARRGGGGGAVGEGTVHAGLIPSVPLVTPPPPHP